MTNTAVLIHARIRPLCKPSIVVNYHTDTSALRYTSVSCCLSCRNKTLQQIDPKQKDYWSLPRAMCVATHAYVSLHCIACQCQPPQLHGRYVSGPHGPALSSPISTRQGNVEAAACRPRPEEKYEEHHTIFWRHIPLFRSHSSGTGGRIIQRPSSAMNHTIQLG